MAFHFTTKLNWPVFRLVVISLALIFGCGKTIFAENSENPENRIRIAQQDYANNLCVPIAIRPCDEVWLVSSRHLQNRNCKVDALKVWRADGKHWKNSNVESFLAAEDEDNRNTVLFAHGNFTDFHYAQVRGFQIYNRLISCNDLPPMRFVIWSWPSEFCSDIKFPRSSLEKSDFHAFFMARLMYRFRGEEPVSLIGYSYGSRIVLGALHLVGGGLIEGAGIEECKRCRLAPFRVTLIAPAATYRCMEPNRSFGKAIDSTERAFVVHNPLDPGMKAYRLILKTRIIPVLGGRGANVCRIPGGSEKIRQHNAIEIGRRHSIVHYLNSDHVVGKIQQNLFGD